MRWPARPALQLEGRTITYAELEGWSNAIAERIVEHGLRGQRIAFVADKKAASYATVLGILKAGCSYVPLPADGPLARWASMVKKAGVRASIGDTQVAGLVVIPSDEGTALRPEPQPQNAEMYVLFTSGSTGGPKGVSVSRDNVAAYLAHQLNTYDLTEQDRFSQFFALTFDLSVHDMFLCWAVGACLCVPVADDLMRAVAFARREAITVWFSVPSLAMLMQRMRALSPNALPDVRLAFFCGEPLTWPVARAFRSAAPEARMVNLYGPTETTIAITAFDVPRTKVETEGIVPIGHPFAGSAVQIQDGELQIRGPQLAAGYVSDEGATTLAFISDPSTGLRWYRTGDQVRADADGVLHFVSRMDDQVKIMGHRVEPAEVDAVMGPLIGDGHCITLPMRTGEAVRLFTFVDHEVDHTAIMTELRRALPVYMLPERIIRVDVMPITAHGKLDRKALLALIEHG